MRSGFTADVEFDVVQSAGSTKNGTASRSPPANDLQGDQRNPACSFVTASSLRATARIGARSREERANAAGGVTSSRERTIGASPRALRQYATALRRWDCAGPTVSFSLDLLAAGPIAAIVNGLFAL